MLAIQILHLQPLRLTQATLLRLRLQDVLHTQAVAGRAGPSEVSDPEAVAETNEIEPEIHSRS